MDESKDAEKKEEEKPEQHGEEDEEGNASEEIIINEADLLKTKCQLSEY